MDRKYLKNIEYDKILAQAAELVVNPPARERLLQSMPLTRIEDVRAVLAQTDQTASLLLKNGNPRLSSCEGSLEAVRRASKGGILSLGELLAVAGALRNFSRLASWYPSSEGSLRPMDDFFYAIQPQPALEKSILDVVLSDSELADNASSELYQLRRKIRQAEGSIREKLDSVIKNQSTSKYLRDAIVSIRNGRFVVPVKAEHRNDFGGVIHDVSASGGTIFVEPTAVVEANAKILQLQNQEREEVHRILGEFSVQVGDIALFFEASYEHMLEIDVRTAKAELGLTMGGICPKVNKEMCFSLVKARHPLLDKTTVVPVDLDLGGEYDTLIVTGPNTGGKTVALKTAGLFCAMAQSGFLLPAHDESTTCVFEEFLIDIGDEQSIEQSLSTFSGHMKNITNIFEAVTSRSLVLLDELGAGTDPSEGAALAISIIETLRESGARIMATTHYAELKMFALDTKGVQNAGSEFNVETLRPTYRLNVGVPGRSNAFLISEKLGIPAKVIDTARKHMSSEQRRFETVLTQLEDIKLVHKKQQDEIEQLKHDASHQLEAAQRKKEHLIQQGEEELAHARQKAKELADNVENSAYALLDEIKRLEKDERLSKTQKAQRAREIVRKEAGALAQHGAEESPERTDLVRLASVKVGQEVFVPQMNIVATVLALPDKSYQVQVQAGAIRTKVPLMELAEPPRSTKKSIPQQRGSAKVQRTQESSSRTEINLLGKTVDEAVMEVESFIDSALMSKIEVVYIIHGRGTGALRAAVQRYLRSNKNIGSYRLGRYGEGEDGVTVAELK